MQALKSKNTFGNGAHTSHFKLPNARAATATQSRRYGTLAIFKSFGKAFLEKSKKMRGKAPLRYYKLFFKCFSAAAHLMHVQRISIAVASSASSG